MSLRFMKRRSIINERQLELSQLNHHGLDGIKQIQRLVKHSVHLDLHNRCICQICSQDKPIINNNQQILQIFKQSSKKSHYWLKKILVGLTSQTNKTLKLFLPDILFIQNDGLQIFSTNKKDYRIIKFAGTTPIKTIYHTMLRLRKQYKEMLQQNYRKTMIQKVDPKFMHAKYYDKLLPSHFHDGDGNRTLNANKSRFQKYVIHKNEKLIIGAIQEHKMNQKQPFCTLRYLQGSWQLLNQKQFQNFSLIKLPQDVVYVQSYIKSKQTQSICFSQYTEGVKQNLNQQLFKKAQLQVMILLGALSKYDEEYDQLQNFQDYTEQLMKTNPSKYAQLITYKIIHFLSMVSSIYIRHVKIKWIVNDIDNVYLQQIIQFDTNQISKRPIRFKLPPNTEIKNFYQDADFFVQIHKQLKKKKQDALIKIREQLKNKKQQEIQVQNIKYENNLLRRLKRKQKQNIVFYDNQQQTSINSNNNDRYLKDYNIKHNNIINPKRISKFDSITRQSLKKSTIPYSTGLNSPRQFNKIINNPNSGRYSNQIQSKFNNYEYKLNNNKCKYNPHKRSVSLFSTQIITKNQKRFQKQQSRKKIIHSLNKYSNTIQTDRQNQRYNQNKNQTIGNKFSSIQY